MVAVPVAGTVPFNVGSSNICICIFMVISMETLFGFPSGPTLLAVILAVMLVVPLASTGMPLARE